MSPALNSCHLYLIQITNERNIKESDILNSRFQKLQQDLQEQMVLSDSIHQDNQQKALELKVHIFTNHNWNGLREMMMGSMREKAYLSTFHRKYEIWIVEKYGFSTCSTTNDSIFSLSAKRRWGEHLEDRDRTSEQDEGDNTTEAENSRRA